MRGRLERLLYPGTGLLNGLVYVLAMGCLVFAGVTGDTARAVVFGTILICLRIGDIELGNFFDITHARRGRENLRNMVAMPSRCRVCKHVFQNRGIVIENSTDVHMSGNVTQCPRCGGLADYVSGRFNVVSEGIEMLEGPQWSWDLVNDLRLGLQQVLADPLKDPVAQVERIDPHVGKALRTVTRGWGRADILALIALILTVLPYFGVTPEGTADLVDEARRRVSDLLHQAAQHGPPSSPSPPPPDS